MKILFLTLLMFFASPNIALAMNCDDANPKHLSKYEYAKEIEVFFVGLPYEPIFSSKNSESDERLIGQRVTITKSLKGLPKDQKQIDLFTEITFNKDSWQKTENEMLYTANYSKRPKQLIMTVLHPCFKKIDFPKEDMIVYFESGQFEKDKFFEASTYLLASIMALIVLISSALLTKKYILQRQLKT